MVLLALNWRVWVVLGVLFAFALARRLWRQWRADRRARRPGPGGTRGRYGSKRP